MSVNKVIYAGQTLVDLTTDTVTSDTLLSGVTAHDGGGGEIVGTVDALKNPYALTFSGASSSTYDGSEAVSVKIPNDWEELSFEAAIASTDWQSIASTAYIQPNPKIYRRNMGGIYSYTGCIVIQGNNDSSLDFKYLMLKGSTIPTYVMIMTEGGMVYSNVFVTESTASDEIKNAGWKKIGYPGYVPSSVYKLTIFPYN